MKTATIDDVPDDVLEHILSFLSPYADLDACMYVCKRWYRTVKRSCEKLQLKFRQLRSLEWVCTTPSSSSNCSNISNRFAHAACYHKSGSIFVFGGMTSTFGFLNDIWKFDLTTRHWERLPSNGDLPQPRASSSLVAYCNTLILFGGWCPSPWRACSPGNAFYNNLHYYSMSTASLVGDWMIVFGGLTASGYTNKIRVLDIRRGEWFHPLTSSTAPSPRCLHSQVVLDKEHLVIIGGECTDNTHLFDVWLLTIGPENATWQWGQLDVINSEPSRPLLWSRQACKVGDKAIILSSPNVQNYYSKGASQSEAARRSVQNNRTGSETNSSLFLRNDEQSLRSHISRAIAESSSQHLVTTGQLRSSASFSRKEQKRRIGIPRGYPLSVYALHLDRAISHRVALWSVVPSSSLGPQDTFFGSVIAGRHFMFIYFMEQRSPAVLRLLNCNFADHCNPMGTVAPICAVSEDVKNRMIQFRNKRCSGTCALILKIHEATHQLEPENQLENVSIEQLRDSLPDRVPRFVLLCRRLVHSDERVSFPLLVIFSSPYGCSPTMQMLYAGSLNHVLCESRISKYLEVRELEELTENSIDLTLNVI
uniref:F-box domain-containing protein n=1 Tax=Trichuris muris TaxID=70415 RepID=A0A5S6QJ80_TRIMR